MPLAALDGPTDDHTVWGQTRRDRLGTADMWSLKLIHMNSLPKQTHRERKQTYGYQRGKGRGAVQFSSVAQSCPTLCDPMDCSTPGLLSITNSWRLLKLMSIESVMPSNHLILCHPLLLLPSIFPSIRVFSSGSALCIRWPKY